MKRLRRRWWAVGLAVALAVALAGDGVRQAWAADQWSPQSWSLWADVGEVAQGYHWLSLTPGGGVVLRAPAGWRFIAVRPVLGQGLGFMWPATLYAYHYDAAGDHVNHLAILPFLPDNPNFVMFDGDAMLALAVHWDDNQPNDWIIGVWVEWVALEHVSTGERMTWYFADPDDAGWGAPGARGPAVPDQDTSPATPTTPDLEDEPGEPGGPDEPEPPDWWDDWWGEPTQPAPPQLPGDWPPAPAPPPQLSPPQLPPPPAVPPVDGGGTVPPPAYTPILPPVEPEPFPGFSREQPGLPDAPGTPAAPGTPSGPLTPEPPGTPAGPLTPEPPGTPAGPLTPEPPGTPAGPLTPAAPLTPAPPLTPGGATP